MAKTFKLEIQTPYRVFFSGDVEEVLADVADGQIGILAGCYPFTAPLKISILKILCKKNKDDEKAEWLQAFVSEGVVECQRDRTVILAGSANWPEEIDYDRVEASRQAALTSLKESGYKFAAAAANKKLLRAETRLKLRAA
jgi:F-type H+-transporting ATPase subunit epsilon